MNAFYRFALVSTVVGSHLLSPASGQQNTIPTLFNTGELPPHILQPDGVPDAHYTLFTVPSGTKTTRTRTEAGGYPVVPGGYFGTTTNIPAGGPTFSTWIGPDSTGAYLNGPVGLYTYETRFDLSPFDAATVSLSGRWSADNQGIEIRLNGNSIGVGIITDLFSTGFSNFTINSGFLANENILQFDVYNSGGSTALRVEWPEATARTLPVPDGGNAILLLGAALSVCGVISRFLLHIV